MAKRDAKQPSNPLVQIAAANSEVEAGILRDALEQEGIPCFVRPDSPLSSLGVTTATLFAIFVSQSNAKRARWVIGERRE